MIESLRHLASSPLDGPALREAFDDLVPPLTPRQALVESARCLYCYDAPCVAACPSDVDVPSFIRSIQQDNVQGAARKILSANILGASCARVCPTEVLCQQACVRNSEAECAPVLIGALQRHAIDHADFDGHPFQRAPETGKHIAVVGAGPAGLACAHRLALHGHRVTIYEASEQPGGLNQHGIARYKLPGDFAQQEVDFVLGIGGIELRCGQRLGDNLSLAQLRADHDAVFLALGLAGNRALGLSGEQAPGVLPATAYIRALRGSGDFSDLPVPRHCVVIGAGNTAIDIAVQLARLGAEAVEVVYRRGTADMGATPHEQHLARDHQVRLHTWARPAEILLDEQGKVRGMAFIRTALVEGRLVDRDEGFELPAEAIFTAIGQVFDEPGLDPQLIHDGDRITVDGGLRTRLPGVYAGGDCTARGQDLTVEAVQQGKLAAEAIHADLLLAQEAA